MPCHSLTKPLGKATADSFFTSIKFLSSLSLNTFPLKVQNEFKHHFSLAVSFMEKDGIRSAGAITTKQQV